MQYVAILIISIWALLMCYTGSYLSVRLPFKESRSNSTKAAFILLSGIFILAVAPDMAGSEFGSLKTINLILFAVAVITGVISASIRNKNKKGES